MNIMSRDRSESCVQATGRRDYVQPSTEGIISNLVVVMLECNAFPLLYKVFS